MKNQRKILTLAGFVFVGLMCGSFKLAKADEIYSCSASDTSEINYVGTSQAFWPTPILPSATSTVPITDVKVKMRVDSTLKAAAPTQLLYLYLLNQDNDIVGSTGIPLSAIPTVASYVDFEIPTTSTTRVQQFSLFTSGAYNFYVSTVANSAGCPSIDSYLSYSWDVRIAAGSGFPVYDSISITSPPQNSLLSSATSQVISGVCPVDGENELMLTDDPLTARLATSTDFTIPCVDQQFSSTFTAASGNNEIWVVDQSVIGELPPNIFNAARYASLSYVGSDQAAQWGIQLLTPTPNSTSGAIWVYPENPFTFTFIGTVAPDAPANDVAFGLQQYTDSQRTSDSLISDDVVNFGAQSSFGMIKFNLNFSEATDTPIYLRAYMQYPDASTTVASYDFDVYVTVTSTAYGTPVHNVPNGWNSDLGTWGDLFRALLVPSQAQIQPILNADQLQMESTFPFSYFYQAVSIWTGVTITTTTPPAIALIIPAGNFGDTTTTVPFELFGGDTTPVVYSFANDIRPYMTAILWLTFSAYFIFRLKDFFST